MIKPRIPRCLCSQCCFYFMTLGLFFLGYQTQLLAADALEEASTFYGRS